MRSTAPHCDFVHHTCIDGANSAIAESRDDGRVEPGAACKRHEVAAVDERADGSDQWPMVEHLFVEIDSVLCQTVIAFQIGIEQPSLRSSAYGEDRVEFEEPSAVVIADLGHPSARLGDFAAELGGEDQAGKMLWPKGPLGISQSAWRPRAEARCVRASEGIRLPRW